MRMPNLALALLSSAALFLGGPDAMAQTLRAANIHAPSQPYSLALDRWAEKLAEASNGELEANTFHAGTVVSNQHDSYSQVKVGSVDLTISAVVGDDVPALQIVAFPYAFRNYEDWRSFMDSEEIAKLADEFRERTGIRILGAQYLGARHLTANQPVMSPEDLSDLKIRAVELPVFLETVRALGAEPTPVAFQEVLTGLKTGVIDGQENPIPTIYQMNFYQAQSHLMLTGHLHGGDFWMMNEARFQSLSPEHQELVQELAREAILWGDQQIIEQEESLLGELETAGMTVIGPEDGLDVQAFVDRVRGEAWPKLASEVGQETLDAVLAMEQQ